MRAVGLAGLGLALILGAWWVPAARAQGPLYVDDDADCAGQRPCYASIQAAAAAAADGAVIRVAPGRYAEHVVVEDKGLAFEGPGAGSPSAPTDPRLHAVWSGQVGGARGPALVVDARGRDVRGPRVQGFRVVSATLGVVFLGRRSGDPVPLPGGRPASSVERTDVVAGVVRGNLFEDLGGDTGPLRGAVVAVWARELTLAENTVRRADLGLAIWGVSQARLDGNSIAETRGVGLLVQAHGDDVMVSGNTVSQAGGRGIEVRDLVRPGVAGTGRGLRIEGNQVSASAAEGIAVVADGGGLLRGLTLSANRVLDAGAGAGGAAPDLRAGILVRAGPGQIAGLRSDGDVVRRTRQPGPTDTAGVHLERVAATVAISRALVSDGQGIGIRLVDVSEARLTGSVVTRNRLGVEVVETTERPAARPDEESTVLGGTPAQGNRLGGNTAGAVALRRSGGLGPMAGVDARFNDWGTAYAPDIEGQVHDQFDDGSLGRVRYLPALGAPDSLALSVEPSALAADGRSTARVTATVADAAGLPVADNTLVALATELGTLAGGGAEAQAERGEVRRLGAWQTRDDQGFGAYGGPGYLRSDEAGASLVWTFDAPALGMAYGQSPAAGRVRVTVDDGQPLELAAAGPERAWVWRLLARDLGPGPHTVTVTLVTGSLSVDALAAGLLATGGTVTGQLRAPKVVGSGRVRALAYGALGSRTASAPVSFTAGQAARLRLRLASAVLPVGGVTTTITAEAWDEDSRPVPDDTRVRLSATAGDIQPETAQFKGGRATATLRSGTELGLATVRGESGLATDAVTVTYVPGLPASLEVTGSRGSLAANSVSSMEVIATVRDAWGHLVADETEVAFTTSMGTLGPGTAQTRIAQTRNGQARGRLQAGRDAGTAQVRAEAKGASGWVAIPFVAPDLRLRKAVEPRSVVLPGEAVTFTLSMANVGAGSVYDTVITDVIPAGLVPRAVTALGLPNLVQLAGPAYRWRLPSLRPGERGAITMTLVVDPAHPWGPRTVVQNAASAASASAAERSPEDNAAQAAITVVPFAAYTVTLTAPESLPVGGATDTVQARIVDREGRQAPDGTLVYFSTSLGTLTPEVAGTRGGTARVTFVTGRRAGTATIRAETQEERGATVRVQVLPAPAQKLELVSAKDRLAVGGASTVITATLADPFANPVPGESVVFTTSLGSFDTPAGLRASFRGVTGAAGMVTTTLVSGARTGMARVVAQNSMLLRRLDIPVQPGPPHFLSLRLGADQITVGDSVEVIGRVSDAYDNPLPAVPLEFSTQVGRLGRKSGVSDAAGEVRTTLYAHEPGFGPVSVTGGGRTAFALLSVRAVEVFLPFTVRSKR